MTSHSSNPLLRSKHVLAPWINFLLFVELTSRVIRRIDDSRQSELLTVRAVLWGMLCAKLAARLLCRYQVLWWTLDYYGSGSKLAALFHLPERYRFPGSDNLCCRWADSRTRIEVCCQLAATTFYSVIEFLSIRHFRRRGDHHEEEDPLVPPSAQSMDREVELTESRHDKHA
jgi:hypothetical protein